MMWILLHVNNDCDEIIDIQVDKKDLCATDSDRFVEYLNILKSSHSRCSRWRLIDRLID